MKPATVIASAAGLVMLSLSLGTEAKQAAPKPAAIEAITFDAKALPKEATFKGKVVGGIAWKDKNGENYLIESFIKNEKTSSVYLYANHYVKDAAGAVKLLRLVDDKFENCTEADNLTYFIKGVEEVSDVDKDSIGEVSFSYAVDCLTDVSPIAIKALVLENGDKYIIRGKILAVGEGHNESHEKKPGEELKKASKEISTLIDQKWEKTIKSFSFSGPY
jgi:hypothetical protein